MVSTDLCSIAAKPSKRGCRDRLTHRAQALSLPGVKQLALSMEGVKRQQMIHADVCRLLVSLLQLRAEHHHETSLLRWLRQGSGRSFQEERTRIAALGVPRECPTAGENVLGHVPRPDMYPSEIDDIFY